MKKKIIVELCLGNGSFSKQFKDNPNYKIISVDILKKFNPTICIDIMNWDYKKDLKGLDIWAFWCGVDCTEYSHALRTRERDLTKANALVQRCLEIMNYCNPKYWFIENPQTGLLKNQEFMYGIPFVDVSYCQYGYDYRKQTRIWTNLKGWEGKRCNKKTCSKVVNGKHIGSAGNGRKKYTNKIYTKEEKYSMPESLIKEIISYMGE